MSEKSISELEDRYKFLNINNRENKLEKNKMNRDLGTSRTIGIPASLFIVFHRYCVFITSLQDPTLAKKITTYSRLR